MSGGIDTLPNKLHEFLSSRHSKFEQFLIAKRVDEDPFRGSSGGSADDERDRIHRSSGNNGSLTSLALKNAIGNVVTQSPPPPKTGIDESSRLYHSSLDSFREAYTAKRLQGSIASADLSTPTSTRHVDVAFPTSRNGWQSTSLARTKDRDVAVIPSGAAMVHDVEKWIRVAELLAADLRSEQHHRLLDEERYSRNTIESDNAHGMSLLSTRMNLMLRYKIRKQWSTRPTQVYFDVLRQKDELEIRSLREQLAAAKRSSYPSAVSHSGTNMPADAKDQTTSEERREWNELYRNMQEALLLQRQQIADRDEIIRRFNHSTNTNACTSPPHRTKTSSSFNTSELWVSPTDAE